MSDLDGMRLELDNRRAQADALRVHTEPITNPFEVGQWIRWTTREHVYEGQIHWLEGPSMQVLWVGHAEGTHQTFPIVEGYFPPYGTGIEVIDKPRSADKIARDAQAGKMSIKRAAALLGVDAKRVRSMLRSGAIRGGQVDGRWSYVKGEDVMARVEHD